MDKIIMISICRKNIILAVLMILSLELYGQEHTHSHSEEGMENAHLTPGIFSVYAESRKDELTLKHDKIESAKEADLKLYIAEYVSNRALGDVDLKISVQEDPAIVVKIEPHDTGVYHLHGVFPEIKPYSLLVILNSTMHGADLLLLSSVEVGKEPPQEGAGPDAEVQHEHSHTHWWIFGLVFIAGMGIEYLFFRKKPRVTVSILIVLFFHGMIQDIDAHGGHGDDEDKKQGNTVSISKETQFLFDIITQQVAAGELQPSVETLSTSIPAPGEYAQITTPQSGKITALNVMPGQLVSAGQTLAVVQPTTNLSERVGVATETGRLRADIKNAQAELAAAERELNRLRSIEDIAARKDVQAAEARYNTAKANLDALRSISSGSVTSTSGSMVLKSPVAGTVGQFSFSSGAEIIAGTTLFTVTSLDKVLIEAQVYTNDAADVKSAAKYKVTGTDASRESDEVKLISTAVEVNPSNQSQKVLFELTNSGEEFKIGEFVTLQAYIQTSDRSIFVPNSALSEINGMPVVFVKDNPENYSVRYISRGDDNGTHSVVLKGLDEGERFVTEGTYQVKMMMLNQ